MLEITQGRAGLIICLWFMLAAPGLVFADQWYLVGQHYHTTTDMGFQQDPESHEPATEYDPEGIKDLVAKGQQSGLDAMFVTEHNTVATCFDQLFVNTSLTLVCGEEWTNKRSLHIGLLNPPVTAAGQGYVPRDAHRQRELGEVEAEARELIASVHAAARDRGQLSLAVINHPGMLIYMPHDTLGADAVEAVVPDYEAPELTRQWWLSRLAEGRRLVALAGSDFHACKGWSCYRRGDFFRTFFDEPVNLVFARSHEAGDLLEAMARGRVVALAGNKYRDVRVELSAEYGGREYRMGDVIADVKDGDKVRLRLSIRNADGLYAVVYGLGQDAAKLAWRPLRDKELEAESWRGELEVTKSGAREAVHVELFRPIDWNGHRSSAPVVLSNPIYF